MSERASDGAYVFGQGRGAGGCGLLGALFFLAVAAYPFYDMTHGYEGPLLLVVIWVVLMVGLALLILRMAEPFELRLYPETRTYRLTKGYPGLKRSRQGTYDDFNCLYVSTNVSKGHSTSRISIRWRDRRVKFDPALKTPIDEYQDAVAEMERLSAELRIPACPKGRRPAD